MIEQFPRVIILVVILLYVYTVISTNGSSVEDRDGSYVIHTSYQQNSTLDPRLDSTTIRHLTNRSIVDNLRRLQQSPDVIIFDIEAGAGFGNYVGGLISLFAVAVCKGVAFKVVDNPYLEYFISYVPDIVIKKSDLQMYHNHTQLTNNRYRELVSTGAGLLFNKGNFSMRLFYDVMDSIIVHHDGVKKFEDLGFKFYKSVSIKSQIRNSIFRLFLNPIPSLCNELSEYIKALHTKELHCYQIRMGGSIAKQHEKKQFLLKPDIEVFVNITKRTLKRTHKSLNNVTIFVSSDSDEAVEIIETLFDGRVNLQFRKGIIRGHSSTNHLRMRKGDSNDIIHASLMDLFILKECDYLTSTFGSSFGNVAFDMGMTNKNYLALLPQMDSCSVYDNDVHTRKQFYVYFNSSMPFRLPVC